MLMKVVLPAPLVPIRPTTESCSMAALTSAAAVTAPKLLHKPLASRMTGTSAHSGRYGPQSLGQEDDDEEQRGAEAQLPGIRREVVRGGANRAVDQRAGEWGDHVARPGEDGDEDEFTGGGPERHLRIDV